MTDAITPDQLRFEWKGGDAERVGRMIMKVIPPEEQVAKAAVILDICRARYAPVPAVEAVATLARTPSQWREGHKAFSAVRALTLREDRQRTNDLYLSLLVVAEFTAKTIYNATEPLDAFDEESPWRLVAQARGMATKVNDAAFEELLWQAIVAGWAS